MNTGPEIAVWALTPGGLRIARKFGRHLNSVSLMVSENLGDQADATPFQRLGPAVDRYFHQFQAHVFIMSTGIVVRVIAKHLRHKTTDPAVVVVDDLGQFAISLVSGHLGGANALARRVANITGGIPVITTATDVNNLPAIDVIANSRNLVIENPEMIKTINMTFLKKQKVRVCDPYHLLDEEIPEILLDRSVSGDMETPTIIVDDNITEKRKNTLYLRPGVLSAGIGCNRGTSCDEIRNLLKETCKKHRLSVLSIQNLATIDLKKDEPGIQSLGEELGLPVLFYDSQTLDRVASIENPSTYAKKYTGAKSVCEAAAILASDNGRLIVRKTKTKNVTIALAGKEIISTSLA